MNVEPKKNSSPSSSLEDSIERNLNAQLKMEAMASQNYLAFASLMEVEGYEGIAYFLYAHSEEERVHMLKILRYINERGGEAKIPSLEEPQIEEYKIKFKESNPSEKLKIIFSEILNQEIKVSMSINSLVSLSFEKKDFITFDFLQWYVKEQREEEDLARKIIDRINLIENKNSGIYLFDKEIKKFHEK